MSEFSKATTQFKDAESLIAALAAMGYPRENIEVHAEPQQLFDYRGRKTTYLSKDGDKANIIIRRKHIGGLANHTVRLYRSMTLPPTSLNRGATV